MTDIARVRAVLAEERARTLQDIASLAIDLSDVIDAATDVATDDEHDPEGSTIAFERARIGALADQGRDHLVAIDAALQRLSAGCYGECQSCGHTISAARLEALPATATCITCAPATSRLR
jgi:DnaK suppressor protein